MAFTRYSMRALRQASCTRALQAGLSLQKLTRPQFRSFTYTFNPEQRPQFRSFSSSTETVMDFNLADIGEGITEVEVLQWFVKPGDVINEFDRVCEVQSDKAAVEITSRYSGTVETLSFQVGEIAVVGKTLMQIRTTDAVPETSIPAAVANPESIPAPTSAPAPTSSPSVSNGVEFNLADIGEGITEVEVLQWFVQPGDMVNEFDRVCEVQSDKAAVEITSRFTGEVLSLAHQVGEMAYVGKPLMTIAAEGVPAAPVSTPSPTSSSSNTVCATSGFTQNATGKVLCSPAVRRIAKENGINLAMVPGTGPKGRILKEDVQNYIASGGVVARAAPPVHTPPAHTPPAQQQPSSAPILASADVARSAPPVLVKLQPTTARRTEYLSQDEEIKIRGLQRVMVQTMEASNQVPTLGYCEEVNMDSLYSFRNKINPHVQQYGLKLSYLPFILKATSLALKQYPVLNAHVNKDCSTITHRMHHNIGVAVDTPKGLVVPVIKHIEHLSLLEIAMELKRLSTAAQTGTLELSDLQGGTFSLSNIGSIGGTYASPLIVTPQVCIGALGKMQTVPRFDENMNVVPHRIMTASWSADHRVIEGAVMARFVAEWKSFLEDPQSMLLYLK